MTAEDRAAAVAAALTEFIRRRAEVRDDDRDFSATVDLFDYGYLDSFGTVEMIELVQDRFGVDLGNVDFYGGGLRSIAAISRLVAERRA